jgi:RNA ligase
MTLHYPFPRIQNIRDVLPYIDDNFRVVVKDELTFINYLMMGNEVFPAMITQPDSEASEHTIKVFNHRAAIRRECRGIVFNTATGDIVSRPFHKFFNAGEREDVALHLIDIDRPHQILEKLDGSMLRPLYLSGGFRWGTKMGITDVGMLAEDYVARKEAEGDRSYRHIAAYCEGEGKTPLFEFCSRRSRIVVDYPVETMVLLAIRDNITGAYMKRWEVRSLAGTFGCPVVDTVDVDGVQIPDVIAFIAGVSDLDTFMETTRASEEGEGQIIVFDDGHCVKIKSDKYVRVHRAKDMMRSEMRLLDLFFNDELDDLLATIDQADQNRVHAYLENFDNEANHLSDRIDVTYRYVRATYETKKDFALSTYAQDILNVTFKGLMFSLWDEKFADANDAARSVVHNGMSSETKFAAMKLSLKLDTGWDEIWAKDVMEYAA